MPRLKEPIPIPLSIFDPAKGVDTLQQVARESHISPPWYRPRYAWHTRRLIREAEKQKPAYFMEGKGAKHLDQTSKAMYASLKRIFHLSSEHERPKTFYERHMNRANDLVTELVERIAPEQKNNLGLLDEVALVRSPGEVLQLLESPDTTPRLRFELTRQVALALTSAQIEAGKRGLRKRIKKLDRWLDVDLFDHGIKTGEGESRLVHTIHDPLTNQVLWLEGAKDSPGGPDIPGITRQQAMRMRYVEGIGYVVINPRLKRSLNAVKKALLLAADFKSQNKTITPALNDRMGMMFIVADQFYNNGGQVTLLMQRVQDTIKNRFHVSDEAFEEKNGLTGYQYQNGSNHFRRIMVKLPDIEDKIELIFTAMGEQLNNDNMIGHYDSATSMHNGPAHSLYEARRDNSVFQMLFPQDDPSLYGHIPFDSISQRFFQRITTTILEDHLVTESVPSRRDTQS